MRVNEVTRRIIGAAYEVHAQVGPGLLESAYSPCMGIAMAERGLRFRAEQPLRLIFRGRDVGLGYRADFLVEGRVIVELKSVLRLEPVFTAQLITYLKLSGCGVGLLLNFNVRNMQHGVKRVVLGSDWKGDARAAPEEVPGNL